MAIAKAERFILVEQGPRSALLLWGGGLLVLGISLVGVGAAAVGAAPLLAGLFNIVYGIHTYGRLGAEEETPDGEDAARAARSSMAWTGGLTALAGVLVAADHFESTTAQGAADIVATYGLVALGLSRLFRAQSPGGLRPRGPVRRPKVKAKVEKRRRMDKSPAP
jgi:hypothetical protein